MENIYEVAEIKTADTLAMRIRITVRNTQKIMLDAAISIGQDLIDAKELVEHGEWENWLENSVGFSSSSAVKYMKISREYSNISKTELITDLSYTKALKLLAVPEEAREEFIENNNVEDMTVKELEAKIAQMKTENESLEHNIQNLKTDLDKTNLEMQSLAEKVKEAEEELSKIETVDGLSDEALQEIREKQEEIDKLLSDLDKSKQAKSKLEEKISRSAEENEKMIESAKSAATAEALSKIEEAKAQARKEVESELQDAKANVEKLSKELAAAGNEDVLKIKLKVEDIQRIYESCIATMSKMSTGYDDGLGGKMHAYLRAVLGQLIERMDD